ncbi:hypothetical protein [Providencia sneebia]|uniref:Uncharacterized protein n=1 Tax=Providencia sneebia DSM 19967 TaxID=1141660 RepID=K8WRK6_9GAMM|nr:hypothetical protein [Providencia sneebia]EKT60067.1 hypothetical protein OO7_04514 [Providencia sneebia DSM 19967]
MPIKSASLPINNNNMDELSSKSNLKKRTTKGDVKNKCVNVHNFNLNHYPNIKQFCNSILKNIQKAQEDSQGRIRFIENPIAESTYVNKFHEKTRIFKEVRNIELTTEQKQKIEKESTESCESIGTMSNALKNIDNIFNESLY